MTEQSYENAVCKSTEYNFLADGFQKQSVQKGQIAIGSHNFHELVQIFF